MPLPNLAAACSARTAAFAFGAAFALFAATPAWAGCNPPPSNLEYPAWYQECQGVLQARWRDSNPYGLPYGEYVRMLWQMYEVRFHPERTPA